MQHHRHQPLTSPEQHPPADKIFSTDRQRRKDGRVVECTGFEIRRTGSPVPRVRIPLFPPSSCCLKLQGFDAQAHFAHHHRSPPIGCLGQSLTAESGQGSAIEHGTRHHFSKGSSNTADRPSVQIAPKPTEVPWSFKCKGLLLLAPLPAKSVRVKPKNRTSLLNL